MGDRRQVKFEDMGIWYYTHWGGCKLIEDLKKAIRKAKSRWDDESYCLRIILSQLIGNDWDSETGHGISNQYLDSEHEDPIVNIRENLVKFEGKEMSFSEFIGEEIPKTNKYEVIVDISSKHFIVEAESEEEAERIAISKFEALNQEDKIDEYWVGDISEVEE